MTTKQPATPLPWHVNAVNSKPGRGRITGDETSTGWDKLFLNGANNTVASVYRAADVRYIANACNAYPELVEALRALLAGVNMPTRAVQKAAALLRSLGEDA